VELVTTRDKAAEMAALAAEIEACRACPLGFSRTRSVPGVGSPDADVMFVGEAPGFHEDQQGEPFVGRAGQLLTQLIETKLGLRRSDVWIGNTLRCRPPENRDPLPEEIDACKPFVRRQLDIVQPKLVVTLGNFASKLLTGSQLGITKLREREFTMRNGTPLRCTFHPAAALRGGNAMKGIEHDFEQIRAMLDSIASEEPEPASDPDEQLGLF
jgi:DNA polymerase